MLLVERFHAIALRETVRVAATTLGSCAEIIGSEPVSMILAARIRRRSPTEDYLHRSPAGGRNFGLCRAVVRESDEFGRLSNARSVRVAR